MEKSFKITLADGTQLKNLKLSGNNYISKVKITEDYFVLRQLSADEIDKIKTKADIEYLAMMTDVDLEEV